MSPTYNQAIRDFVSERRNEEKAIQYANTFRKDRRRQKLELDSRQKRRQQEYEQ